MNLTQEEQRKLTVFLNECWHELEEPKGSVGEIHFGGSTRCKHCGERMQSLPFYPMPPRLDFSDWRVVGRLQEKYLFKRGFITNIFNGPSTDGIYCVFEGHTGTSLQEAICRAVLAYIDKGE